MLVQLLATLASHALSGDSTLLLHSDTKTGELQHRQESSCASTRPLAPNLLLSPSLVVPLSLRCCVPLSASRPTSPTQSNSRAGISASWNPEHRGAAPKQPSRPPESLRSSQPDRPFASTPDSPPDDQATLHTDRSVGSCAPTRPLARDVFLPPSPFAPLTLRSRVALSAPPLPPVQFSSLACQHPDILSIGAPARLRPGGAPERGASSGESHPNPVLFL